MVNSRKTEILAGKSSDPTEGGGRNRNPGSKSSGIWRGKGKWRVREEWVYGGSKLEGILGGVKVES